MSRSSPGVLRVAAILNFIADHPGQAFALTDLVRALKLSRATCHALLTGLVDVGYLYRTSDKTYVLGPALAAIGRTAVEHFSPLQVAQPEMRSLADEFDVVCGIYFLEGDTVHLRDRAASVSHVGYPIPLGNSHSLRVTLAPVFFAGSPQTALSWFGVRYPEAMPEQRLEFERTLEFNRDHGFSVIVRRPGYPGADLSIEEVIEKDAWDMTVETLGEVQPNRTYGLAAIFAPVFESRGGVCFALGMAGFHGGWSGNQIVAAGERLRAACERISNFISLRSEELAATRSAQTLDASSHVHT